VAAAVRKDALATIAPQTGWFRSCHVSECILETFRLWNPPVRSAKDASRYFFGRGHPCYVEIVKQGIPKRLLFQKMLP